MPTHPTTSNNTTPKLRTLTPLSLTPFILATLLLQSCIPTISHYLPYKHPLPSTLNHITTLTPTNYLTTINTFDYLAIFLSNTHCQSNECHDQQAEFTEACQNLYSTLKAHPIFCSTLDLRSQPKNSVLKGKKYFVHDPSIILFIRGTPIPFSHYHERGAIQRWLERNSVNNLEAYEVDRHGLMVDNFETGNRHSTVVYAGAKGNRLYNIFEGLSAEFGGYLDFYWTSESSYYITETQVDLKDKLIVHPKTEHQFPREDVNSSYSVRDKEFDYQELVFGGEPEYWAVREFILKAAGRRPVKYSPELLEWAEASDRTLVLLALSGRANFVGEVFENFVKASARFHAEMTFVWIDDSISEFERRDRALVEKFGWASGNLQWPAVTIHLKVSHFHGHDFGFDNHTLDGSRSPMDQEAMVEFFERFLAGKTHHHVHSEFEPESSLFETEKSLKKLVRKVVGHSFIREVFKTKKNSIVLQHDGSDSDTGLGALRRFEHFVRANVKSALAQGDGSILKNFKFSAMNGRLNKCPLGFTTTPTVYLIQGPPVHKKSYRKFDQGGQTHILNALALQFEQTFGIKFSAGLENLEIPTETDL